MPSLSRRVTLGTSCVSCPRISVRRARPGASRDRRNRWTASLPGELRRSPGVVRRDAFLCVLAFEEPLLKLALESKALLESDLQPRGHRALDEADGARRLRWRHELAGVLDRALPELSWRRVEDGVDQPEPLRLVDADRHAFSHHLDRLRAS